MLPTIAFTKDVIIFGIAPTTVVIICGSACMSDINRRMPASIINGIDPITALIILSIICGIASTIAVMIVGSAVTNEVNN
jgi:hypothetical protein